MKLKEYFFHVKTSLGFKLSRSLEAIFRSAPVIVFANEDMIQLSALEKNFVRKRTFFAQKSKNLQSHRCHGFDQNSPPGLFPGLNFFFAFKLKKKKSAVLKRLLFLQIMPGLLGVAKIVN